MAENTPDTSPESIWATFEEDDVSAQIEGDVYAQKYREGMTGSPTFYIRADLHDSALARIAELEEALRDIAENSAGRVSHNGLQDGPCAKRLMVVWNDICSDARAALEATDD